MKCGSFRPSDRYDRRRLQRQQGLRYRRVAEKYRRGADYDLVIAIGPIPMMKAVSNLTKPYGIKTIISMNTIMVDGTGMCGGCRLTVGGETKFACVDGPDFDGPFGGFRRGYEALGTYKPEEAREREEHCRLYGGIK